MLRDQLRKAERDWGRLGWTGECWEGLGKARRDWGRLGGTGEGWEELGKAGRDYHPRLSPSLHSL